MGLAGLSGRSQKARRHKAKVYRKLKPRRPSKGGRRKRKRKRSKMDTAKVHGEDARLHGRIRLHKKPRLEPGQVVYTQSYEGIYNGAAGSQSVSTLFSVGSIEQWLTSTGPTYTSAQSAVAFFSLNPNEYTTGSPAYTGGVIQKDERLCLKYVSAEVELTNAEAIPVEVDLYWCVAKKNTIDNALSSWNDGLNYQRNSYSVYGTGGPGIQGAGTTGYPQAQIVGEKPYDSKLFRDFWKIVRHDNCIIAGNGNERINVGIDYNWVGKRDAINNAFNDGLVNVVNTMQCLMVCRGQVVADTTTGSNVPTFAYSSVLSICTVKHVLRPCKGGLHNTRVDTVNLSYATGATKANQKFISAIDTVVALAAANVS